MSARRATGALLLAALAGEALGGCFFQPRSDEELFDVPFVSSKDCVADSMCDDGNPCTRERCMLDKDGYGYCAFEMQDEVVPDDANPCTRDVCVRGSALHPAEAAGTACGLNGALSCDGDGACVGCGGDSAACGAGTECKSWTCEGDRCVAVAEEYGLIITAQTEGDCAVTVCNGYGGVVYQWDDLDAGPDPEDPCRLKACSPYATPQYMPEGTPCGQRCFPLGERKGMGTGVCSGTGHCGPTADMVQCEAGYGCEDGACKNGCASDADCFNARCDGGACVP